MENIKTQGIVMPKLGLGTFRMQGDVCRAAVESGLALGYRHVDTAEMYGNEEAIGAAVAASRVPRAVRRGVPDCAYQRLKGSSFSWRVHQRVRGEGKKWLYVRSQKSKSRWAFKCVMGFPKKPSSCPKNSYTSGNSLPVSVKKYSMGSSGWWRLM